MKSTIRSWGHTIPGQCHSPAGLLAMTWHRQIGLGETMWKLFPGGFCSTIEVPHGKSSRKTTKSLCRNLTPLGGVGGIVFPPIVSGLEIKYFVKQIKYFYLDPLVEHRGQKAVQKPPSIRKHPYCSRMLLQISRSCLKRNRTLKPVVKTLVAKALSFQENELPRFMCHRQATCTLKLRKSTYVYAQNVGGEARQPFD